MNCQKCCRYHIDPADRCVRCGHRLDGSACDCAFCRPGGNPPPAVGSEVVVEDPAPHRTHLHGKTVKVVGVEETIVGPLCEVEYAPGRKTTILAKCLRPKPAEVPS
jgi:hypothetical protein